MSENNNGIGLATILFVVFLVLKLTENIDWSWVWVFSPYWIQLALLLLVWVVAFFVAWLNWMDRRRRLKWEYRSIKASMDEPGED